ncbi:MAG: DUF2784 domain-containing protein [Magnetococcus sp. DMHC-8]
MIYRYLADGVLCLHLLFVLFVLGGGWLVMRWPRLGWVHLPCVAWGVTVAFSGWICPLTRLENHWRRLGGAEGYPTSFVEHYLLPLLYPDAWWPGGFPAWGFALLGAGVLLLNGAVYLSVGRRVWHRSLPVGQPAAEPVVTEASWSMMTDRRASVRVDNTDATGVMLAIRQADGTTFDATLLAVGAGGCTLVWPDEEPRSAVGMPLVFTFFWCDGQRVSRHGTLLRWQMRGNEMTGDAGFAVADHDTDRAMGELVTWMERIHLRTRRDWSPTETENLAELYRSSAEHLGKNPCHRC